MMPLVVVKVEIQFLEGLVLILYGQVEYSSDSDVITDFTAGNGGDIIDLTDYIMSLVPVQEIYGVAQNLLIPMDISDLIKMVQIQLSIMTETV